MPVQTSFNPNGRKELKHAISKAEYYLLRTKLLHFMRGDPNAGPDGKYLIRSTYFDNFDNKILIEKKEGFLNRDKYRVRIYGLSDHVVNLERKSKRNNLTYKSKCTLTRNEYEKIRSGDIQWMEHDERGLIRDLHAEMAYHLIRPLTVVDYEREAFTYPYGNVRVTFDMKVQSSLQNTDMFNKHLPMVDVLEANLVILEVKYDEYIPEVIKCLLQLSDTRQEAYSKYQLSRMYGQ
ncbi:polyphosphate polymerase domain-containing protein [Ferdinandcohnia sp. SAFN-114]|uniref:polyphosphate polymerase domain-containing protein n=1 Tax=Ferdinandcohnia sp. SAFN-114 TaxID=3387275 RepID=UPI003F7F8049